MPIGKINPGHQYALLDENDNEVPVDGLGELCVTGPQVALGYFHAQPERRDPFFRRPGSEALWYRTGGLVSCDAQGNLIFRGRTDSQVKVSGHRVELLEVDHWLQKILLGCQVVSLSWPFNNLNCDCIYSAIETSEQESLIRTKEILDQCRCSPSTCCQKTCFFLGIFRSIQMARSTARKLAQSLQGSSTRTGKREMSDQLKSARDFIVRSLEGELRDRGIGALSDDFNLITSGLLDSFGFLDLVTNIEAEFAIEIDFSTLDPAAFSTLGELSQAVVRQLADS